MIHVITIVDDLSVTSMPVNEFVVYRAVHNFNIKQSLIACCPQNCQTFNLPKNVDVYYVKMNPFKMRDTLKKIINNCKHNNDTPVIHIHQPKSAFIYFSVSWFFDLNKRSVFTVHSTFSSRNIEYKIESIICALFANYVTCVSKTAYEEYPCFIKNLKKERIRCIVNGVDTERIDKATLPYSNTTKRMTDLYCVARIIPIKNQRFLIDVIKEIPDCRLFLIGAENSNYNIRSYIAECDVREKVILKGLIPRDDVFRELMNGQIYVSASTVEGMPVSVLEAMYLGLIPILSDIKAHRELFDLCNNVSILPLEKDLWVKRIKEIITMSSYKRASLINNIIKECKNNFSLSKMHDQYMSIYEVLGR